MCVVLMTVIVFVGTVFVCRVGYFWFMYVWFFFFQAEDGIRDLVRSRGLGDVYKRQGWIDLPGTAMIAACRMGRRDRRRAGVFTCGTGRAHALMTLSLIHI